MKAWGFLETLYIKAIFFYISWNHIAAQKNVNARIKAPFDVRVVIKIYPDSVQDIVTIKLDTIIGN